MQHRGQTAAISATAAWSDGRAEAETAAATSGRGADSEGGEEAGQTRTTGGKSMALIQKTRREDRIRAAVSVDSGCVGSLCSPAIDAAARVDPTCCPIVLTRRHRASALFVACALPSLCCERESASLRRG